MQWKVLLGDFGLFQVISETNAIGTRTMLAGSPGFQSPEQLTGESIGIPSDVYAFGAVALVVFGEKNSLARSLPLSNHVPSYCFKCKAKYLISAVSNKEYC